VRSGKEKGRRKKEKNEEGKNEEHDECRSR
jgi:hypothetical protein